MIEVALAFTGWALLIALMIWLLSYCLRIGAVGSANAGDVRRSEKPIAFWVNIVAMSIGIAMMIGVLIFATWKTFLT